MYSLCLHSEQYAPMFVERKKNSSRSLKKANIRGIRRLQHLGAILLLYCGQVRCTELNSNNNGKKGRRDKRGLSLLLNPFTTGRSVAWGTEREHQATSGEATGMTNSQPQRIYLLYDNSSHTHTHLATYT